MQFRITSFVVIGCVVFGGVNANEDINVCFSGGEDFQQIAELISEIPYDVRDIDSWQGEGVVVAKSPSQISAAMAETPLGACHYAIVLADVVAQEMADEQTVKAVPYRRTVDLALAYRKEDKGVISVSLPAARKMGVLEGDAHAIVVSEIVAPGVPVVILRKDHLFVDARAEEVSHLIITQMPKHDTVLVAQAQEQGVVFFDGNLPNPEGTRDSFVMFMKMYETALGSVPKHFTLVVGWKDEVLILAHPDAPEDISSYIEYALPGEFMELGPLREAHASFDRKIGEIQDLASQIPVFAKLIELARTTQKPEEFVEKTIPEERLREIAGEIVALPLKEQEVLIDRMLALGEITEETAKLLRDLLRYETWEELACEGVSLVLPPSDNC